jgi:hypothetical protein
VSVIASALMLLDARTRDAGEEVGGSTDVLVNWSCCVPKVVVWQGYHESIVMIEV